MTDFNQNGALRDISLYRKNFINLLNTYVDVAKDFLKKSFWDRLESKQFAINIIALMATIFFCVILGMIVVFNRSNLDKVYNILYLILGFIGGLFGTKIAQNGKH